MARADLQRKQINSKVLPTHELQKGMHVYDTGIPHIFGVIIEFGIEGSTVRWKDNDYGPKEGNVPNKYLAPIEDKMYLIKISRRGDLRSAIPFGAAYVAARFVDAAIGDEKYTWKTKDMISLSESGFELSCDGLESLIEYKYKKHEKAWELPEPYRSWAKEISTGVKSGREMPDPIASPIVTSSTHNIKSSELKVRTRRPPPDSGMIPLSKICDELGIEGRDARVILRKKMKKSESGWNFKPEEIEAVKKLLRSK